MTDEALRDKIAEALAHNRAVAAGMAFGVPSDADLQYRNEVAQEAARVAEEHYRPLLDAAEKLDAAIVREAKRPLGVSSDTIAALRQFRALRDGKD